MLQGPHVPRRAISPHFNSAQVALGTQLSHPASTHLRPAPPSLVSCDNRNLCTESIIKGREILECKRLRDGGGDGRVKHYLLNAETFGASGRRPAYEQILWQA